MKSLTDYERDRAADPQRLAGMREASRWRTIDRGALVLAWASDLEPSERLALFRPDEAG